MLSSTARPSRRRHGFTPRHSSPTAHTTRATDPATVSAVSAGPCTYGIRRATAVAIHIHSGTFGHEAMLTRPVCLLRNAHCHPVTVCPGDPASDCVSLVRGSPWTPSGCGGMGSSSQRL
jgi:hypothetical protein